MNVLITGGTGSFGQAFTEHILKNNLYHPQTGPGKILIYSRDEHKQEKMANRFKELDTNNRLRFFIGDIRDKHRLKVALREAYYIIHTAALKVVPTAEYNPFEAIKTNIIGSQNLIDCCLDAWHSKYMKVIALSTDKAVNPINLYGATKLCMEKMFIAANNIAGENGPKFSVVRYGNVANSNGSVIQLFKEQKQNNKSLTLTDERMTRYWIELNEAVEFVFSSLYKMQGKEIFIPKMPSFKLIHLAKAFKHNYIITGVREGEKLHEQIDENKYSHTNDGWLTEETLGEKLKEMSIL